MPNKNTLKTAFLMSWIFAFGAFILNAQTTLPVPPDEKNKQESNRGFSFRIPDKVLPMDWHAFKGILMLEEKRPGGIFVCYPNEGESIADLKFRAKTDIARMFVKDEKIAAEIAWDVQVIHGERVDSNETASMNLYDSEEETIQIALYERKNPKNGLVIVYGNFARKSKTSKKKDDSIDLLDNDGKGSKKFDKFRKSFSP